MLRKRFYLTKEAGNNQWHYVGDPLHANTTFDVGMIKCNREEIRVDEFGTYIERIITGEDSEEVKRCKNQLKEVFNNSQIIK